MLQVVVGGLIALLSKWVLEGGIRSRERHVIREELELANLLGPTPEAADLQAIAHMRLLRYLRPPLHKRAAPFMRTAAIFVVAVVAGEIVLTLMSDSGGSQVWVAVAVGASVGALAQGLQLLWERYQEEQRLTAQHAIREVERELRQE